MNSTSKNKGKEREVQPTDIAERFIAMQRRTALPTRPRSERPPAPALPPKSPPRPAASRPIDADQFARMHISASSSRAQEKATANKHLYNPNEDSAPPRRAEESIRVSPKQSHVRDSGAANRQLFDHRKDDPVRFRSTVKPTVKSEAYVSASDTASQASSVFTLSSTTDGSSASSALFDHSSQPSDQPSKFSAKIKSLYREITSLEAKVKAEDVDDGAEEPSRIILKGRENQEDIERERWQARLNNHKELAELIWRFLKLSLQPSVPASLRSIPTKYNINARLWTLAFHKLLESLRHASRSSNIALEHLQDFIIYAYTFYGGLLEVPFLETFRGAWLEALGDLARYKYAVTSMIIAFAADEANRLTTDAVHQATEGDASSAIESQTSDEPAARIDDSAVLSVGAAAARLLEVEPEKERWRCIAREWYSSGLTDTPGTGRLHHHLGLLSRDCEGEELRGVYHFTKSMATLHPFPTSRESILPLWSAAAQARRSQPDTRVSELFVLLHGMLFTNIQLDDFQPTLARFVERLQIEGAEEREWMMMGIVNIVAILEYGKPAGVLRRTGGVGVRELASKDSGVKVMTKRRPAKDDKMDVDEQPSPSPSESENDTIEDDLPLALTLAMQLTFRMLRFVLRSPTRRSSPFARATLNPYLTIILTFLATVLKNIAVRNIMERSIPWTELALFFTQVPSAIMSSQKLVGLKAGVEQEQWAMLTSGCAPPLPEDWCMRGMEWVGRKLFERGYWKSGEDQRMEMQALDASDAFAAEITDGTIEEDGEDEEHHSDMWKRWVRLVRCGVEISRSADGFKWEKGTRKWCVEGVLAQKVQQWKEEDEQARLEEERRRAIVRWDDDDMDVDEDAMDEDEGDSDSEGDSEQVKELKARRRYLRSLLQGQAPASTRRKRGPTNKESRLPLNIAQGYTVLVIDTNVFLSMLSLLSTLIESNCWTVVIPLPVIMELEGIASNNSPLGQAAQAAMTYITDNIRTQSNSMKVQTSKGNFLSSLNVRTEEVDFSKGSIERSMDDLILKAAIWQDEHWMDRSNMLRAPPASGDPSRAVKVVLITLDRNLRVKARSRQLAAATESDLASIFATST